MSEISFHCCISLGSKGIFCSVHFGKSLKWGCQLRFPLSLAFSDSLEKNPKGGHPSPFMYLQSQSVVDGHIVLQDPSWI